MLAVFLGMSFTIPETLPPRKAHAQFVVHDETEQRQPVALYFDTGGRERDAAGNKTGNRSNVFTCSSLMPALLLARPTRASIPQT